MFRRLGQRLHLKCLAFWCCIKTNRGISMVDDLHYLLLTFFVLELSFAIPTPWSEELHKCKSTKLNSIEVCLPAYSSFWPSVLSRLLEGGGRGERLHHKVPAPRLSKRRFKYISPPVAVKSSGTLWGLYRIEHFDDCAPRQHDEAIVRWRGFFS